MRTQPPPQFLANFYCGQMAECITMSLGMEVGLSPEDFVFDGYPVPVPKKGGAPAQFSAYVLWPNGWTDQDGTWNGCGPWPRPHCARWGTSSPPQKGAESPIFVPFLLSSNCWMNHDNSLAWRWALVQATLSHCGRWGPIPSPRKGAEPPPQFSAHFYCL